jgi:hypothetical protein
LALGRRWKSKRRTRLAWSSPAALFVVGSDDKVYVTTQTNGGAWSALSALSAPIAPANVGKSLRVVSAETRRKGSNPSPPVARSRRCGEHDVGGGRGPAGAAAEEPRVEAPTSSRADRDMASHDVGSGA